MITSSKSLLFKNCLVFNLRGAKVINLANKNILLPVKEKIDDSCKVAMRNVLSFSKNSKMAQVINNNIARNLTNTNFQ